MASFDYDFIAAYLETRCQYLCRNSERGRGDQRRSRSRWIASAGNEGLSARHQRLADRSSCPVFGWLQGTLALALVASLFVLALRQGLPEPDAHALTFTALVAANLGLVLVNRSRGDFLKAALGQPNTALWWVVAVTTAILAAAILFPPARELFNFGLLHVDDVAVALGSGIAISIVLELAKMRLYSGGRTEIVLISVNAPRLRECAARPPCWRLDHCRNTRYCGSTGLAEQFYARLSRNNAMTLPANEWLWSAKRA